MATRNHTTVGTLIPEILTQLGVTHVFGIPGNHTVELYRGLAGTRIRHITARHEQGAAFMADGYARASGQPGVCFLIGGPGLLNAATGIVQAQQDSVPLVIITTYSGTPGVPRALHEMPNQTQAASGMCKKVYQIDQIDQVASGLCEAYRTCSAPSPGAVIVQFHVSLLNRHLSKAVHAGLQKQMRVAARDDVPAKVRRWPAAGVVKKMTAAQKPVLLLGGGAQRTPQIADLAERWDAPVFNTVNAKGVVPRSHPLSVGASPSLPALKKALAAADLVLALGTEYSETDFDLLMCATPERKGEVISFNTDHRRDKLPDEPRWQNYAVPVENAVPELLKKLSPQRKDGVARAESLRHAVQQEEHMHADFAAFFRTLRSTVEDCILVGDSTRPTYYAAWMYECDRPGRYFHSVSGFGTLGYAIPAALGAEVGSSIPVLALIGDGGAQFTLSELATAADNGIRVPVIVWQNEGYEEITNSLRAAGVGSQTTEISAPDYLRLARAYGIPSFAPRTHGGLRKALTGALKAPGPSLILVRQNDFVHSASGSWYG